jgi:hypothetical protein
MSYEEPKSYVGLEQHICKVCGKPFDTGALLFDKRLRDTLKRKNLTGWGWCPEDAEKKRNGYIALVGVLPGTGPKYDDTMQNEEADRSGRLVHLKAEAFAGIFNCPVPPEGLCFVEDAVIEQLVQLENERASQEGGQDEATPV